MVCGDPESGTKGGQCIHYLVQGTHMGPPRLRQQVIFGALLCIFTESIHVNVKNSTAEGTCCLQTKAIFQHLYGLIVF